MHFTEADPTKFVPHTTESLEAVATDLAEKRDLLSDREFSFLEQCHGVSFNPHALLFSDMKDTARCHFQHTVDFPFTTLFMFSQGLLVSELGFGVGGWGLKMV